MDKKLSALISELGGKHGGLVYFRENVEGGKDRVLPLEILKTGEKLTRPTRCLIRAACKDAGTDRVIVRTSDPSDWGGMVDTMPTEVCSLSWLDRQMKKTIEEVRRRCFDPKLIQYAQREGNDYDPERVTVSIIPYVDSPNGLVTEHPNQLDTNLIDVSSPKSEGSEFFIRNTTDFVGGKDVRRLSGECFENFVAQSLNIPNWVRQSGSLPVDSAFQFEQGFHHKKGPQLFQIRVFAPKRLADFTLMPDKRPEYRNFGITPQEGITLRVAHAMERGDFEDFERKYPNTPYLLAVEDTHNRLVLDDQPAWMRGYAVKHKPSLSHQATRLAQMCLRHPDGVVLLNGLSDYFTCTRSAIVRIISDGRHQLVERVE